jgi:hypothetical protein
MNRFFVGMGLGIATSVVATAFVTGVRTKELQRVSSAVNSTPLCYVTNKFSTELQIQVIDSKFTSGTYFIQPQKKGIFFCGDELKLINGQYKTKLTLKKSISVEDSKARKNVVNI